MGDRTRIGDWTPIGDGPQIGDSPLPLSPLIVFTWAPLTHMHGVFCRLLPGELLVLLPAPAGYCLVSCLCSCLLLVLPLPLPAMQEVTLHTMVYSMGLGAC